MPFNRPSAGILLRLVALLATLSGAGYWALHGRAGWAVLAGLLLAALTVELASYLSRGQRQLADFLLAVQYRDFTQHFDPRQAPPGLRPLYAAFNQLNATFRELRAEKDAQFHYLQTILALLDTGLLAYDATGQVEWVNDAFTQLLALPYLNTLQALQTRHTRLYAAISRATPHHSPVVEITVNRQVLRLLLSVTRFKLRGRDVTLLAVKNVTHTLASTETDAWQKLLRVMTHEIMNSVTPIASLADTLRRHLALIQTAGPSTETPGSSPFDDVAAGLSIIQQRSEGLLRFAQVYRNFSTIATPQLMRVPVQALFQDARTLLEKQFAQQHIRVVITVHPAALAVEADRQLLEQVLINLLLNAIRAVTAAPQPQIQLLAHLDEREQVMLEVIDNGTGIAPDLLESIFIPFFTTDPGGSGIGLSLAQQIMQLHHGSIHVHSEEGAGSRFQLRFP
ncbi:PAS domain-containing sensor histidine kinase [Hymenobacter sp. DG01]|uniref:sensor histidine kinase n=1 Tax=Hymenobacter sp. DG01 TaxID=2584940 RepID=UPI00111D66F3|nr:ATP-binding protein [Hymenobacter sp. DG01]